MFVKYECGCIGILNDLDETKTLILYHCTNYGDDKPFELCFMDYNNVEFETMTDEEINNFLKKINEVLYINQ